RPKPRGSPHVAGGRPRSRPPHPHPLRSRRAPARPPYGKVAPDPHRADDRRGGGPLGPAARALLIYVWKRALYVWSRPLLRPTAALADRYPQARPHFHRPPTGLTSR